MPHRIPQSVAIRVPLKGYLAADHLSDAPSLDPAVVISKNAAAFGNPAAGATVATEVGSAGNGNGWYYVDLGTADTDTLGPLIVRATHATMDPIEIVYQVVNPNNMGAAALPNAAAEAAGGLYTRGTGAGQINQDANGRIDGNVAAWLGTACHAATVNGVPVVQLHNSAGTGGINAPANFEDLSITDTTGLVAVPTTQKVDLVDAPNATALGVVADAVCDEALSGHSTGGTVGKALADILAFGAPPAVGAIADQVWDEAIAGHAGAGSTGAALSAATAPSAAAVADAVCDEALSGHTTAGTVGKVLSDAATAAELAKVPKSDSTVSFNATALGAIADAVADEAYDGSTTLRQSIRLANSANAGKLSGAATTTVTVRDLADTKDRIVATVDSDGNRSAVVTTLT